MRRKTNYIVARYDDMLLLCLNLSSLPVSYLQLPWNKQKTWEGSLLFFIAAVLFTLLFVQWFYFWRWFSVTPGEFLPTLLSTALIATVVESLPAQEQLDNVTVFVVSVLFMKMSGY